MVFNLNNFPTDLTFDDIQINLKNSFQVKITEELIHEFAKISGDFNPLHVDPNYSKQTKFKKQIAHGMLLASFFSKLVGMDMPGKRALYLSQTLNFQNPCFINDVITVEGKVKDKSLATKIISIETKIYNKNNEILVDGIAKVMVLDNS